MKTFYTDLTAYQRRQGAETYEAKWLVVEAIVHPLYDGSPACGFDIALLLLGQNLGGKNYTTKNYAPNAALDMFSFQADPTSLDKSTIRISGYPGDADKVTWPYTHSGPVFKVAKTTLGGYVIYYQVDTTPGNSGSPIQVTDATWVNQCKSRLSEKFRAPNYNCVTIGVHTGALAVEKLNFGTLLTPELFKWMTGEVDKFIARQKK